MTSIERELGNLQARMETVESELHAIREDMREIRDAIVGAKSSWRFVVVVIGLATSLGAALNHYLPLIAGFKN